MNKLTTAICLAAFSLAAAAQTTPAPPPPDLPDGPTVNPALLPPVLPTGPTVLIDTTMGRLTCKLFTRQAPITTANFIGLAQGTRPWIDATTQKKRTTPFFNGLTFHRVIPDFMIQGGDPVGDGTGDPGYFFADEIDPTLTFDVPGRLAMANAGAGPNGTGTNGSQFFITEAPVPQLNGKHTIFGQCDPHSVVLVSTIARVERDANDKPRIPVVMNKVTIVPDGSPLPPEPAAPASPVAAPPPVPR